MGLNVTPQKSAEINARIGQLCLTVSSSREFTAQLNEEFRLDLKSPAYLQRVRKLGLRLGPPQCGYCGGSMIGKRAHASFCSKEHKILARYVRGGSQRKRVDPCKQPGCPKKLVVGHTTAYCKEHQRGHRRKARELCAACGKELRLGNETGYCPEHQQLYWDNNPEASQQRSQRKSESLKESWANDPDRHLRTSERAKRFNAEREAAVAAVAAAMAELEVAKAKKGRRGRRKAAKEKKADYKVGAAVQREIPLFGRLFEAKKAAPASATLRSLGFTEEQVEAALSSNTPTIAARRFISNTYLVKVKGEDKFLDYDTVSTYHQRFLRFLRLPGTEIAA
jgi:hypothetical protein